MADKTWAVWATEVAEFLGRGNSAKTIALAEAHLPVVTAFVRAYVRGKGFVNGEPNEDLAAVIISATARLVPNPSLNKREQVADTSITFTSLEGFTLPEQAILHLYRRRAA